VVVVVAVVVASGRNTERRREKPGFHGRFSFGSVSTRNPSPLLGSFVGAIAPSPVNLHDEQ